MGNLCKRDYWLLIIKALFVIVLTLAISITQNNFDFYHGFGVCKEEIISYQVSDVLMGNLPQWIKGSSNKLLNTAGEIFPQGFRVSPKSVAIINSTEYREDVEVHYYFDEEGSMMISIYYPESGRTRFFSLRLEVDVNYAGTDIIARYRDRASFYMHYYDNADKTFTRECFGMAKNITGVIVENGVKRKVDTQSHCGDFDTLFPWMQFQKTVPPSLNGDPFLHIEKGRIVQTQMCISAYRRDGFFYQLLNSTFTLYSLMLTLIKVLRKKGYRTKILENLFFINLAFVHCDCTICCKDDRSGEERKVDIK